MIDENPASWRRTLSRVVLGLLLAGAVYLFMEALGFGASRKQREIVFSLPPRPITQLEVLYFSGDNLIRGATLPVSGNIVTDTNQLSSGRYELEVVLRSKAESTTSHKVIELGEETKVQVDLRNE